MLYPPELRGLFELSVFRGLGLCLYFACRPKNSPDDVFSIHYAVYVVLKDFPHFVYHFLRPLGQLNPPHCLLNAISPEYVPVQSVAL